MSSEDSNKYINNEEKFPLVSILLAVYKPRADWFIEQLVSLNEQTYKNLELIVYDDCPENPVDEDLVKKYITNFKYSIVRGKVNQGSNKVFEELTKLGNGEYFSYCDQDDIWEKNKISLMMDKFKEKDVTLVCADLCIINENDQITAKSITDIRKRIIYKSGYNLAKDLLMTNFVTGCAMIVRKDIALKSIPFVDEMIHDQWIAIIAALDGKIEVINEPLVRYRQHSNNQTGILKGVVNKETYYQRRIDDFLKRYIMLKNRIGINDEVKENIDNCLAWLNARKDYALKPNFKDLKVMIKYRNFHKVSILIECLLPFTPDFIFKYIIILAKKGIL